MPPRDWLVIGAGALGVAALMAWWLRKGFDEVPMPSPVPLGPADPAQRFGAAAASDAVLADELLRETDGDVAAAESRFESLRKGER